MIRILLALLSLSTILSCKPDSKSSTETASTSIDFKKINVTVPFSGNWISEDYLNQITKHQSPRKAQEESGDCFIRIPGNTLQPTVMVYNFHEGGAELVTVKGDSSFQLWEKQNDSLTKPVYTVEIISSDKIRIGEKTFTKINPVTQSHDARILEEILFKGQYTTKKGQPVEFKNTGEITGLEGYKYYLPIIDYFDAGLQIDQVGLGESMEKMEYFGFKFRNNSLELYALKCLTYDDVDKRCVDVDFGKLVHTLKKNTKD